MDYATALRQGMPGTPSGPGPQYIEGLGTFRPGETWDSDLRRRLMAAGGGALDTLTLGMGVPDDLRALMKDQPEAASSGALAGAVLPAGEAVAGLGNIVRAAPKMSAALLGTLGLGLNSADAGPKLTKRQMRALEMEKQKAAQDAEAAKTRALNEIEIESQRRKANELLDAEAKAKEANTPFRERFPEIAGMLPTMGLVLSGAVPFALRGKANLGTFFGGEARQIDRAMKSVDKAVEVGNPLRAALEAKKLEKIVAAHPGPVAEVASGIGKTAAAGASGGALAAEASMFPDQYDAVNLKGPEQDAARERALNPANYAERALMGTLTGASAYKAGNLIPKRKPDLEGAASYAGILKNGFSDDVATVARNISPASPAPVGHWNYQPRKSGQFAGPPKYPNGKKP